MTRLVILVACILGLTACASSEPPAVAAASADPAATAETSAAVAEAESLEVIEVPAVAKTATAPASAPRDELVCWRERPTGSHRLEKICRYKSEIEQTRKDTQRELKRLTRRTDASGQQ